MGKKYVRLGLISLFSAVIATSAFAQAITLPAPSIDVLHYSFKLTIHDYTNEIEGEANIFLAFKNSDVSDIEIYLAGKDSVGSHGMIIDEISYDDQLVEFNHSDHRVRIKLPFPAMNDQRRNLKILYHGTPADGLIIGKNKYGDRTFFGDNWPNRAHYWLPTNDHPSDKATCEFIVTAPAQYEIISNGVLLEESYLPQISGRNSSYKVTHWAISKPIPTKVMVFGAARFAVQYSSNKSVEIENWVYPEDREVGFKQFTPTANIVAYYESLLGSYPYAKLANVQSKTQYGGMENASAIFYNEATITNQPSIEALVAHEIAHQWFGNAVSEKEWSDVWLSEGFSTYLTHLYFEHTYGRDSMSARLLADKARIFSYHLQSPESSVVDLNEVNLFQLLNANSYQKGAWVLHMLRAEVSDKVFFKILREFYNKYKHKNASTKNFISLANKLSGKNLVSFFDQWLSRPDYPVLQGSWKYNALSNKLTLSLEQVQSAEVYTLPVEIGIYSHQTTQPEVRKITFNKRKNAYTFKVRGGVKKVVIDPNCWLLQENTLTKK